MQGTLRPVHAQELLEYLQSKAPTDDTPIEIRISFSAGEQGTVREESSYEIEDYETMDDGTIVLHA